MGVAGRGMIGLIILLATTTMGTTTGTTEAVTQEILVTSINMAVVAVAIRVMTCSS